MKLELAVATLIAGLVAQARTADADCGTKYGCGLNSPTIQDNDFFDLSTTGSVNESGFSLLSFQSESGHLYGLTVESGKFVGTDSITHAKLEGQHLINATLHVHGPNGDVFILIKDVKPAMYASGQHTPIDTYHLVWYPTGRNAGEAVDLCVNPPIVGDPNVPPEDPERPADVYPYISESGIDPVYTVIFEGDHIDAVHKTIVGGIATDWFNVGCAGHALGKLHLTHNTSISDTSPVTGGGSGALATARHQAVLKMLTAAYCATGTPWTVNGQPLVWKDTSTMDSFFSPPLNLEARWNKDGVVCWGANSAGNPNYRLLVNWSTAAGLQFGSPGYLVQQIARRCRTIAIPPATTSPTPTCSVQDPNQPDPLYTADVISANPPPPP